jgi:glycosyltransferase involved in cell wall biosynthesis
MNISFVLAVYNKLDLTKECYRYLRNQYPTAPLVISSGGSSDGTKEWLESLEDENLSFIHDDDRLTFSDTYNAGIKLVDTEKIVLIHNDMVIGKPVLFLDVRDPLGLELVSSVERPGESFTGVVREDLPALVIAHYYSFFIPFLDTVLIPYTENDIYLLAKANDIKKCLNARNIKTHLIALPANSNGIESALQGYTDKVQGLILFDSCFIHALQEQFAYWCWKNEIIFFGTGPDVIAAGAACAVRNDYESLINAAYEQLRLFWEYKTPVSEIPVKVLNAEEEFLINIDILLRIGMPHELIKQVVLQPGVCAERTWTRLPKAFE